MNITMNNQRIDEFFATGENFTAGANPEALLRWSRHLVRDEQVLLQLILRTRLTREKAGEILGVPKGTITRRLQRISKRMLSPIGLALVDDRCTLPEPLREIGIAHILRHESLRQIARRTGRSLSEVRSAMTYVRGWHRGAALPPPPGADAK